MTVAYNIEVDSYHTYFVSEFGLWLHNACPIGANGTQFSSKTVMNNGKFRIDVENPAPGKRPGQIHYQDKKGNKYLYDHEKGEFKGAPKSLNDQLKNDSEVQKAIDKGMKYLGEDQ